MVSRIAVVHEAPEEAMRRSDEVAGADLLLAWHTEQANVQVDLGPIHAAGSHPLPESALDLLDIAIGVFIADIAVQRGRHEAWPRDISLALPVRDVALWQQAAPALGRLAFELTRDNIRFEFYPAGPPPSAQGEALQSERSEASVDCVSMLSGGLDSLAGAVMLQAAGRTPAWSLHRSGNPTVATAQTAVRQALEAHWPGQSTAFPCSIEPTTRGEKALPFPVAEEREPSRRARSLLFIALALATAEAAGVEEVYMCENGVLTAALPLAPSRAGSMSTHSTHPAVLHQMNLLAEQIGLRGRLTNPFVYQTKGELLRDVLAPTLSPKEIQGTISCWMAGRAQRQCGGCVPCLLRRLAMEWAGLPEEAYMIELLENPRDYVGTDSYGHLIDLLRQIRQLSTRTDEELLMSQPGLLSLHGTGCDFAEVTAMLRRHAEQSLHVLRERYPRAAALMD